MSTQTVRPDDRRCIPVRLDRIPLDTRITAARSACRIEQDPDERQAILFAALRPSDRIYWVAP